MPTSAEVYSKVLGSGLGTRDRLMLLGYLAARAGGVVIPGQSWNRMRRVAVSLGLERDDAAA
jgi:hypothetical protein